MKEQKEQIKQLQEAKEQAEPAGGTVAAPAAAVDEETKKKLADAQKQVKDLTEKSQKVTALVVSIVLSHRDLTSNP